MSATLIDPAEAFGLVDFSGFSICGAQLGVTSCLDGSHSDLPEQTIPMCGIEDFNWEAENEDDDEASDACASYFKAGKLKWWEFEMTFCSRINILIENLARQVDVVVDDDDPNKVLGYMDLDYDNEADDCCPTDGCVDDLYMMIWALARCGEDPHPEFSHAVMYIPRLSLNPSEGGEWERGNFTERTWTGRWLKPLPGHGRGPGDILPESLAGSRRRFYVMGTNSPPPTCGGCVHCESVEPPEVVPPVCDVTHVGHWEADESGEACQLYVVDEIVDSNGDPVTATVELTDNTVDPPVTIEAMQIPQPAVGDVTVTLTVDADCVVEEAAANTVTIEEMVMEVAALPSDETVASGSDSAVALDIGELLLTASTAGSGALAIASGLIEANGGTAATPNLIEFKSIEVSPCATEVEYNFQIQDVGTLLAADVLTADLVFLDDMDAEISVENIDTWEGPIADDTDVTGTVVLPDGTVKVVLRFTEHTGAATRKHVIDLTTLETYLSVT